MLKASYEIDIFHPKQLREIRRKIHPHLVKEFGKDQLLVDASISEAIINAWEHGHKRDLETPIHLKIHFLNGKLIARVRDQGDGFDWRGFQLSSDMKHWFPEVRDLDDHGRGIILMFRVMDVLRYNDKGNECLLMKKYLRQE
ncbi:ATP-binding protein [Halobacillus yeomjeoni]|uniref:ATP-binding protein n=1 Tax=Halobacillus yeomjeoni TaxID=311194 RepID=A0A931MTP0_9BACI|nr:ATP-binding protein [Halobacillus yeomjeoni]MBH0228630.1 ATP-binding protein [Halobacillus yeomjeoni]